MEERIVVNIALCEARHTMPENVTGAIYPNTVDPLDIAGITETADVFMREHSGEDVNVYVTGLTVCTIAVVKAAMMRLATDKPCPALLTLWHFDRATGGLLSPDHHLRKGEDGSGGCAPVLRVQLLIVAPHPARIVNPFYNFGGIFIPKRRTKPC